MLKKLGVVIPSVVLTLLMAVGFSTPAFAYVEPEVKEEPVQVIEEEEPTEEEKIPFTIAGNGEVEDNITDDSSKEFFTVKTKGGNTFFLVIDRARNSENVYMLSMIDEYDLQEFLTDEERNGNYNMIDGCVNNVPKKPRVIGGRVSVLDRLHIKQAERARKDNAQVQQQERTRKT